MGQTLTHGIYLPDEGERNCYNGLAANWQLLDGAVGTVAEHTTQIAGKAPLVHTHTKSDITDFPALATVATSGSYNDLNNIPASFTPSSHTHGNLTNDGKVGTTANVPLITGTDGVVQAGAFGNAANTFCEGNDSRLSDARTPVAHTHTKSDVTDLLNSNFIPSANNSYDLGSSSYQWNNIYSKGYYYNGVAWGLDKANVWTGNNVFYGVNTTAFKTTGTDVLPKTQTYPASTRYYFSQRYYAYNDESLGLDRSACYTTGENARTWYIYSYDTGAYRFFGLKINADASVSEFITEVDRVIPKSNNATDLGTSTNKWKSLNGVNPGALSFPNMNATTGIDISGSIVPPSGETTINISGGINTYTATINGWLCISKVASACRYIKTTVNARLGQTTIVSGSLSGAIYHCQPVPAGQTVNILLDADSQAGYYFYPCLGNV